MSEYGLRDGECIWVRQDTVTEELSFGEHAHSMTQLAWVRQGQMVLASQGRQWVLAPSQAIWVPSGRTHDVRVLKGSELYCVYLWEEEVDVAWSELTVLSMNGLARELVRHLAREDLADVDARHARATLLSALSPARADGVDLPVPVDPRARAVAEAVLGDPSPTHALSDWALRLHTSEKTIQRAFLAETGMTFSQWRTQVRLFHSLPLLADQMPVSAVATRIGYTSTNGFASAFRRHFGTTPASYFSA